MKSSTLCGVLAFALCIPALADDATDRNARPTFYKDVLPILQENCQVCHREGGANFGGMYAPMAFTDYANVSPSSAVIPRETRFF